MKDIEDILEQALLQKASDVYLKAGSPPTLRVGDEFIPLGEERLYPAETEAIAAAIMDEREKTLFQEYGQVNLALSLPGRGRFRVNIYRQRSTVALVLRQIQSNVPRFEDLTLPPVLLKMVEAERGLVLVVGATGSGKSTTLAALIHHRNTSRPGHIVTIEDPIEFLHQDRKCLVSQREVGTDVGSFHEALRDALRQTPDVILIGEMRDAETVSSAINFAETGHLVLSTLHSTNAAQTLERILQFYPGELHAQVLAQVANNLVGIVAQRLVPRAEGQGLVPAVEVLRATPRVRDLLHRGALHELKPTIEASRAEGMQSFDQALYELFKEGRITEEMALLMADSPSDLKLRMRGFGAASIE